jgi:hypothetical protein
VHLPTTTTDRFGARTKIAKHVMMNKILSRESKKSLTLAESRRFLETKRSKRGKIAMKVTSCAKARTERRRLALSVLVA